MADAVAQRRKRGYVRASITRLSTRLTELEKKAGDPSTLDLISGMSQKLETLDSAYRTRHIELVDTLENEDEVKAEQEVLDNHDDEVAQLSARIKRLVVACSPPAHSNDHKIVARKLTRTEKQLSTISATVDAKSTSSDPCLLSQLEEQLRDLKSDLSAIFDLLAALDLDDSDPLVVQQDKLEKLAFDIGLRIKKLLAAIHSPSTTSSPSSPASVSFATGVKLPKLEAPTFDGNILNWRTFWEQFEVSIDSKTTLTDAEKLVYLQSSLKDRTAKGVIEGLSRSGEFDSEAIASLKTCYDRPRLVHQTHVQRILNATPVRDGTGSELRRLHDLVQQHLRALSAMGCEPSGQFITSMLELKLDTDTMFEWQRFTNDLPDVSHYSKMLEFLNLCAQASEASISTQSRKTSTRHEERNKGMAGRHVSSFHAGADDNLSSPCVICKTDAHHLFACSRFKALPHDKKVATLKSNNLCMNCLRSGHFVKQCKSLHRCRHCQRQHNTLLHVDPKPPPVIPVSSLTISPSSPPRHDVTHGVTTGLKSRCLLMTCRVLIRGPDGSSVQSRAILDSASSASFVSERLVQSLHLRRTGRRARIFGVAGLSHDSLSQSITEFFVSPLQDPEKMIDVTAVIVPRVTCHLPLQHIPFRTEWTHLSDLELADPDFGVPSSVDLLLGVDVFVEALRQGRRSGPPGSPSAFETIFGWVIAGETACTSSSPVTSCHSSIVVGDDILRQFWELEESHCWMNVRKSTVEERLAEEHFQSCHRRMEDGMFVVPLPRKCQHKPLGESRSQAVR